MKVAAEARDGTIVWFCRWAVVAQPEVLSFAAEDRKLALVEGLQNGRSPEGTPNHAWLSLRLLETLLQISQAGYTAPVRQLLEQPLEQCPEVLLLGGFK